MDITDIQEGTLFTVGNGSTVYVATRPVTKRGHVFAWNADVPGRILTFSFAHEDFRTYQWEAQNA